MSFSPNARPRKPFGASEMRACHYFYSPYTAHAPVFFSFRPCKTQTITTITTKGEGPTLAFGISRFVLASHARAYMRRPGASPNVKLRGLATVTCTRRYYWPTPTARIFRFVYESQNPAPLSKQLWMNKGFCTATTTHTMLPTEPFV